MEHNVDNLLDAFISLRDVPDEAVEGMLKTETKLTEGKAFNIYNGADVDEAIDYFTNFVDAPETELEVIDVDANTIRHLKDKTEYVGQGILRCNRCKSNMFINMDDLKPSEEDPELYNIGDECPHCHSEDAGFELIGQVGKVESETEEVVSTEESSDEQKLEPMIQNQDEEEKEESVIPEPAVEEETMIEEPAAEEVAEESTEEEFSFENPSGEEETIKFENNEGTSEEEPKEENEEEPAEEETIEVETGFEEEEEPNPMETTETEEEVEEIEREVTTKDGKKLKLKLTKKLGDVYEESFDDASNDEEVKEALVEEITADYVENNYAEKAWMLGQIMQYMNDEDAYFGSWLYIWPDGETREECEDDFGNEDDYADLKQTFDRIYRRYHSGGLFEAPPEVEAYAHEMDRELGLKPIENLFLAKRNPESVDEEAKFKSVREFLKHVNDPERIDHVIVAKKDYDIFDESKSPIFEGMCNDLTSEVDDCKVKCFNTGDGFLTCVIDTKDKNGQTLRGFLNKFDDEDSEKIILWDADSGDDCFTGCKKDAVDHFGDCAFHCIEAPKVLVIKIDDENCDEEPECLEPEEKSDEDKLIQRIYKANNLSPYKVNDFESVEHHISESIKEREDLEIIYNEFVKNVANNRLIEDFKKITGYKPAKFNLKEKKEAEKNKVVSKTKIMDEAYHRLSTGELVYIVDDEWEQALKDLGKTTSIEDLTNYYEGSPNLQDMDYDSNLLARILKNKLIKAKVNNFKKDQVEDIGSEEVVESYSKINESVRSFKTRKELSEAIAECKNNSRPYTVKRSLKEGYRYDLIEAFNFNPDDAASDYLDAHEADYISPAEMEEINQEIADKEALVPAETRSLTQELSSLEKQIVGKIQRIAKDIQEAIKERFNVNVNPGLIVADIMQDLKLISHEVKPEDLKDTQTNRLTINMFKSYEATMVFMDALMSALTGETFESTPARRLTQAVHMLDTPAFSREAIFQGINSDAFTNALEQGAVPYLDPAIINQASLPAAETNAIEVIDDELDESFDKKEIDFPTDEFDRDINEYFKSAYADGKVIYMTDDGAVTPDGTIILEGSISMPNKDNMLDMDVRFTLIPVRTVSEKMNSKRSRRSLIKEAYKVTNNLSEEVFEFKPSIK